MRRTRPSEREQLDLFRALPGDLAPRDAQDLMAYPFFSLAKSKRVVPIDFRAGTITIRVEAVPEHGMATIWDADVLIWAASQIVEARDAGLKTSRLMAATPYEILTYVGRGTGARDYDRLKAGLDRLQSTTVLTSIRQPTERRRHRFSWINEWKETADAHGRPFGLELILPDWFYAGVLDDALVLTIDRAYFDLTGGLERWLYRLVRKHGASRRSSILLTTCARSSVARRCLAIGSLSSVTYAAPSVSSSRLSLSIRSPSGCASAGSFLNRRTACESARAIGDRNPRAIRDPILVLSGTEIGSKALLLNALQRP
jgi:plasmid replication initiation protein